MTDTRTLFDLCTAAIIFALAAMGIFRRVRRLLALSRIILVEPVDQRDVDYLDSIKRSTYLRLGVKVVFFIGSLIMLFNLPLFEVWRAAVILALVFMNAETASVDRVRDRLGKAAETKP